MPKWEDLTPKEREDYVNQDYVYLRELLVGNIDNFPSDQTMVDIYDETRIPGSDRLEKIMSTLTDNQQEVVELYYLEGLPERKIAYKLNISRRAVRERLKYAKSKIYKIFRPTLPVYT